MKGMNYGHQFYQQSVHLTNCDFSATLGYYGLTVKSAIGFW